MHRRQSADPPLAGFDLVSPENLDQLAAIINGTPPVHLQVLVPYEAFFHDSANQRLPGFDGSAGTQAPPPIHDGKTTAGGD